MRRVSDLIIGLVPTAEVSLFVFVLKRGECPNESRRVDFSRVGSSSTGCDVFKSSAHCQKLTMITFNIVNISRPENFIMTIFHFVNISHIDNIPFCQYLTYWQYSILSIFHMDKSPRVLIKFFSLFAYFTVARKFVPEKMPYFGKIRYLWPLPAGTMSEEHISGWSFSKSCIGIW